MATRAAGTTAPRPVTRPAVVETAQLGKRFGDVEAVRGVDLRVPANAVFGFLGPNGAGKTTTIKMLVGLLRPTSGQAQVLGLDALRDALALRRRVGFLPQQPVFYDDMTARQTLRYAGGFFDFGHRELERRIDETLDLVGLTGRADRSVRGFSGGERQRLGLAQAQLHDPELLILDEPAAGLDPLGRRDVLVLLERLRRCSTVVYSTHILDDVQRVSDTVAIIKQGRIIAQGPMEDLLGGGDAPTYRLELTGAPDRLREQIAARPWVTTVATSGDDGLQVWDVEVTDRAAADAELLRMVVAEPHTTVVGFGRRRHELEDVFVQLVEQEPQP